MIKKNIITIAVICAVLGLTGCGSSTVPDTAPQTDETAAAETGTTAETTSSPAVQTTSAVSASAETTTAAQTDAPAAATAGKPDCKPLAGSWRYQSDGRMQGSVKVTADGSFTYQPLDDSGAKNGKVTVSDETFNDGTTLYLYNFNYDDSTGWISLYVPQNWNTNSLLIGQDGTNRLVRENLIVNADGKKITYTDSTLNKAYKLPSDDADEEEHYAIYRGNVPEFACADADAAMQSNLKELNDLMQQTLNEQVKIYDEKKYPAEDFDAATEKVNAHPFGSDQTDIDYMIDFQGKSATIFLNNYWYSGGAHGIYGTDTVFFDTDTMKVIRSLDEISAAPNEFVKFAAEYFMQNYAEKYEGQDDFTTDTLTKAMTGEGTWYFTDDTFTVEFPVYSFGASYADGPQYLRIPLELCVRHFNEYGKQLLPES